MKKFALTILCICICFLVISQNAGIRFEKDLSWQEILAKAKKENKFIFVDCYTTWCGPCKYMAKNIFLLKETGDAVNPKFISVGMQLDSTSHDSDTTKRGYPDAHMFITNYQIQAFPTFLFFNPDGKLIHRAVGSTDAVHFISYTQDALQPDKQYYTMIAKYRNGDRDTILLRSLAQQASSNGDPMLPDCLLRNWLNTIKDPFSKDKLELIAELTNKTADPGFDLFYHNAAKIDQIEKPGFAEKIVMDAIIRDNADIMGLFSNPSSPPDWGKISYEIKSKFGTAYAHQVIVWIRIPYYKSQKKWDLYGPSLIAYLKEYGDQLQAMEMNNYAWDIFEYCTNKEDLETGISYMNRILTGTDSQNPAFIDTYANLLYKSGKTAEAIAKETEAVQLIDKENKPAFERTLDKMKAGQKTWD